VADFVKGVAGDILRAVGIEVREGRLVAVHRQAWVYFHGYLSGLRPPRSRIFVSTDHFRLTPLRMESQNCYVSVGKAVSTVPAE
jgi:hypothetical protein